MGYSTEEVPQLRYSLIYARTAEKVDQDHFALRPQKRGGLFGTGISGSGPLLLYCQGHCQGPRAWQSALSLLTGTECNWIEAGHKLDISWIEAGHKLDISWT